MIQIFLRRNKIFTNIFSFPQHSQKHCLFYFRKKNRRPKFPEKMFKNIPKKNQQKKNIIDWEKRSKDQKVKRGENNRKYIEKIPSKSEQKEKNQNDEK